tara:strand:+ start:368462 stop:371509 length:3048 start_codon:yes stop_codon:yes gene_type:complete
MADPLVKEAEKEFKACASDDFNNDLLALIKSRHPLVFISSHEEKRLLSHLNNLCIARNYDAYVWDCFGGLRHLATDKQVDAEDGKSSPDKSNPEAALNSIIRRIEKSQADIRRRREEGKEPANNGSIYVLLDFYKYFERLQPAIQRRLRHLATHAKAASVIMTGPSYSSVPALDKDIAVLDFPYPNEYEIGRVLDTSIEIVENKQAFTHIKNIRNHVKKRREDIINAVKGLTLAEAQSAYFKSLVMGDRLGLDPFDVETIMKEKRSIISKSDILEFIAPKVSLDDVGGLDNMTEWFKARRLAFSHEAQQYGLPMPKGALLLGVSGGGKSLTAKGVAKQWNMPLLRLDFGALFNSLVGASEERSRMVIDLAEAVAPCVSGDTVIQDINGNEYVIEDLLNDDGELKNNELYIFGFNEETKKLEPTRVQGVIRHASKKEMIRISTAHSSIEVTKDHRVMVNRDGDLHWVEAQEIDKGDLVMAPKLFMRRCKKPDWKSAISIPYDSMKGQEKGHHILFSKKKGHFCVVNMFNGFNPSELFYMVGLIDGGGWIDAETGKVSISLDNWEMTHNSTTLFCEMFGVEPLIEGNKRTGFRIETENKIAGDILSFARENLMSQEDEYISHYLSGVMDASGDIYADKKFPKVIFNVSNDFGVQDRVAKAMHVFGILAPKRSKSSIVIDTNFDMESAAIALDLRYEPLGSALAGIVRNRLGKDNRSIGYKFGSSLTKDRDRFDLSRADFSLPSQTIASYERGKTVPFDKAYEIAEKIAKVAPSEVAIKDTCVELMQSDLVGVAVTKIEEIGSRYAYDLACEKNHNFIGNNILVHNCVLWWDEIEKGLSGGVGQGSGDSGTTKRVISTFLTWMQEKTAPVFVVATGNNVHDIPPEFMRAGRFDETFWIDLPGKDGREQIFHILLGRKGRDPKTFDIERLAEETKGWTGAEIEKAIHDGMFISFADNKRTLTTEDISVAISKIRPLSETRKEELQQMRTWAKERCTFANTDVDGDGNPDVPDIDLHGKK